MTTAIDIKNVSFSYTNHLILDNVSIQIPAGSFIGIIGPNGGGKTTFLKLIMGLLSPLNGRILLFDQSPTTQKNLIGYVPQSHHINQDFPISVKKLILLGAIHLVNWYGRYPKTVIKQANDLIHLFGLSDYKNKRFGSLSGGLKQRALFARSLMNNPDILILDEPTNNMDRASKKKFFELLMQYKSTKTIIMVDHDIDILSQHTTNLLSIDKTISQLHHQDICQHVLLGCYHLDTKVKETP